MCIDCDGQSNKGHPVKKRSVGWALQDALEDRKRRSSVEEPTVKELDVKTATLTRWLHSAKVFKHSITDSSSSSSYCKNIFSFSA